MNKCELRISTAAKNDSCKNERTKDNRNKCKQRQAGKQTQKEAITQTNNKAGRKNPPPKKKKKKKTNRTIVSKSCVFHTLTRKKERNDVAKARLPWAP